MREGFDAKGWGEAWDKDLDDANDGPDAVRGSEPGAKSMFALSQPPPLPPFNEPVPEQTFLAKNYDENAKKPDRDPRGAFKNPTEVGAGKAGVVGPMGSSSFNLPNVERALVEMEGGSILGESRKASRRDTSARAPLSASVSSASPPPHGQSRPSSALPSATSPAAEQSQHEVLQKFFNSLLSNRTDRGVGSPSVSRSASGQGGANGSSEPQEENVAGGGTE